VAAMTGYIVNRCSVTLETNFESYNGNVGAASKAFKLFAGHPALELVNTLDMRFSTETTDLLPAYGDLLRLATQLRLLTPGQARRLGRTVGEKEAHRVLSSTIELREALASLLYGRIDGGRPQAAKVETLQKYFHTAALHRRLLLADGQLIWSWSGMEQQAEIPLWKLAQAASDLLVSSDAELVKDCGDPTCRWLFLDTSKNHTRRWCDMKTCGNRMKARRHQARYQDGTT
jgi:predicted RNA-binding Zn ribbon-like protein